MPDDREIINWARMADEQVIELLRTIEWPRVTMTQQINGNVVDSGFVLRICPYCATTVPENTEEFDFKKMHVDFHSDVLTATDYALNPDRSSH